MTCPSPPMFQNFMRNAGAIAREIRRRTERSCIMTQNRLCEAKLPPKMVAMTSSGLSLVSAQVTSAHTRIAHTRVIALIPIALYQEIEALFTI